MIQRKDVQFRADGAVQLRGWLFLPDGPGPHPAITMAHGYAAAKEHGLEPFARAFAESGFVVLVHDHRGFGASNGSTASGCRPMAPDRRLAAGHLLPGEPPRGRSGADRPVGHQLRRMGHAIVLGATDRRLRAVVSQVPTISGFEQGRRRVVPEAVAALEEGFSEDERAQLRGEAPRTVAVVGSDPAVPASYRTQEAIDFYLQPVPDGVWENEVTVRSTRAARMYEPGIWVDRVSPTPLLMVVALDDTVTVTDMALAAYERALEPKRLRTIPGGHFDPYTTRFDTASGAAVEWFREHLA